MPDQLLQWPALTRLGIMFALIYVGIDKGFLFTGPESQQTIRMLAFCVVLSGIAFQLCYPTIYGASLVWGCILMAHTAKKLFLSGYMLHSAVIICIIMIMSGRILIVVTDPELLEGIVFE